MPESKNGLYIDGQWVRSARERIIDVENPYNRKVIAQVRSGAKEDALEAIAAANAAFPYWSGLTARERSTFLYDAYQVMMERKERLATILTKEQGKPLKEARSEIEFAASFLQWYAEEAKRVYGEIIPSSRSGKRLFVVPQPIGVVAAITPWNFPAAMVTRKIAPALAAGCTVVLKPAEQTPLSAIEIVEIFHEIGLPKGVVNLVTGDPEEIGDVFVNSKEVRALTFTGSTEVGKKLMEASATNVKKLSLELGGHAPFIVLEDADIELATDLAIASKFRNGGQTCICTNRIFVHESIKDAFLEKMSEKVKSLKLGNGLDEGIDIGPLINEEGVQKVRDQVEDAIAKGAEVVVGGKEWDGAEGYFYEPTILRNVNETMKIMSQETFGPVVPIQSFKTTDEAIAAANHSSYGLAAFLFTNDINQAFKVMEKLEYGIVGINDVFPGTAEAPFGGIKESGLGKEGGRDGILEFIEKKYVSLAIH